MIIVLKCLYTLHCFEIQDHLMNFITLLNKSKILLVLSIKMKLIVEYYSVLPLPSHFSAPFSSVFVHILLFFNL